MPTVRFEPMTFGATRSPAGGLVETIKKIGATAVATPTGASAIRFGPVTDKTTVVVRAIGAQIYAAIGGPTPEAGPAPLPATHIVDGGYALMELEKGDAIAVVLATLS